MNKTYGLNQESTTSTAVGDFQVESESETLSSAADSTILNQVDLKIEKLEGRQRRILAKIQIPFPLDQVWQVLTDYEAFAEFMPSLSQCQQLEHPTGGIRVKQVRTKNLMGMHFSVCAVFDIEERFPHEIHYQLIEGDMKEFSGYWRFEALKTSEDKAGVCLIYDFLVLPKAFLPAALIEHVMSHDIPANMLAIRQRIDKLFG